MSENLHKVLCLLREHPNRWWTMKELGRELGLHYVSVWRVMVLLEGDDKVEEQQIGFRYRAFKLKSEN